jgi:DNA polymerase-4
MLATPPAESLFHRQDCAMEHIMNTQGDALRWLYVDFNSYFASVEQQENPALRGRPVIVVPVETDATCAIAASYEAKAFGIRTGTMVHEAKRLCPGVIQVLARHDLYVAYHERIKVELEQHFPVTAVCSIDEMAYRLMRNDQPEEAAVRLARQVKRGLARAVGEHVRCSIGIAPNRYLAKVATDLQKPDGLTVLHPSDLPHRLHALALRDLPGIGANMERRLREAGIHDVEALMALPAPHLRAIWGSVWGERMWALLRGIDLPEEETERRSVGHSHVLPPELRAPDKARDVARRLTLKAATRMRRYGCHATGFHFSARLENGMRLKQDQQCWRARDSETFLKLLDHAWARMIGASGRAPVKKLGVVLHGLIPDARVAPDLFETPAASPGRRRGAERLWRALDALNQTYGRDTVSFGLMPAQGRSFSGTKIAFTRIPEMEEFRE